MLQLTWFISKLFTDNCSIIDAPVVITDSTPGPTTAYFNTTFITIGSSD